jgi:hypothetical protein
MGDANRVVLESQVVLHPQRPVPCRRSRLRRCTLAPTCPVRLTVGRVERPRTSFGPFQKLWGRASYSIGMILLYLTTIGVTYFIQAGMRRHFKNAPPLILLQPIRDPLALTLTSSQQTCVPIPRSRSWRRSRTHRLAGCYKCIRRCGFFVSSAFTSRQQNAVWNRSNCVTPGHQKRSWIGVQTLVASGPAPRDTYDGGYTSPLGPQRRTVTPR